MGLWKQIRPAPTKQRPFGEPLIGSQNRRQEPLSGSRRVAMIKLPADDVIKIGGRLSGKIPEAAHVAALALRAIVARTRSATSSPVR
jgi:hypothetical protein